MLFECTPRWLLARLERRGNVFPKGDFSNWVQQGIIYAVHAIQSNQKVASGFFH